MSEAARFWGRGVRVRLMPYPHRRDRPMNWTDRTLRRVQGRAAAALSPRRVSRRRQIARILALSDRIDTRPEPLAARLDALRPRLLRDGLRGRALIEAMATVRAVFLAEIGFAHRPVQILGALRLLEGRLLEMATGEGKSATACLAAAVTALAGLPVHVVTVNDYLAGRDAETFAPVFGCLGLDTGLVAAGLSPPERQAEYRKAIVYVDNKELVFDYLKDRLALGQARSLARHAWRTASDPAAPPLLLRGLHFAIIDEADSILIDEAGTPLIISAEGEAGADADLYRLALDLAGGMSPGQHFVLEDSGRRARLRPVGEALGRAAAGQAGGVWRVPKARRELLEQAVVAIHVMQRSVHYIVSPEDGVVIVDEFTGRAMPDRSWRAGLHQMVELKEGLDPSPQKETVASITYQRFFRQYLRVSGMTGTGLEVAGEMRSVYDLVASPVPTHRPVARQHLGTRLTASAAEKRAAILARVRQMHAAGRPVLVGVRSVGAGDALSQDLAAAGLPHELLSAQNEADEAGRIAGAGAAGAIMVATNMAGRGTDIPLGPGVAERGGLHVILTEFHESRRIDRQLYGRAGRQGEPGSCEDIVAIDDDLFRRHAAGLSATLGRFAGTGRGGVAARLLRRHAQRRAEAVSASQRRAQLRAETERVKSLAIAGNDPV
ncbi:preprotein translocase subunit SecA [Roseisalinus antarcticus]|uniref:Preprotein translocase subunit SecA n=1 Tax=Roseisalinus antarcticus TaxID=254357 RepID=A0A1Y5TZG0_9RHOB|nr:translocase [Roseisalinus antarcticus]SLN72100.1 preprotein translocase subunit SecA [Roseisalinus antarcticus]